MTLTLQPFAGECSRVVARVPPAWYEAWMRAELVARQEREAPRRMVSARLAGEPIYPWFLPLFRSSRTARWSTLTGNKKGAVVAAPWPTQEG